MGWRLARSLITLRDQIDAEYPKRNKDSDGTRGDPAHADRPSDHNPNTQGVVCGLDLTNHPGYFDAHALADRLIRVRHPNLKYIISNRRIASAATGWKWSTYKGTNPHNKHIHISVGVGPDGRSRQPYDNTTRWAITKKETAVSTDALTEYEMDELFKAYFGTKTVPEYARNHKGRPLTDLIKQFRSHPMALMNEESLGIIGPVDQDAVALEKERLYKDQIEATKKVFGK
jgi:hypothetical protein